MSSPLHEAPTQQCGIAEFLCRWTFRDKSYSETWTQDCARAAHAYHLACSNELNTVVIMPDTPDVVSLECLVYSAWGDFWCAFFGTGSLVCFSVFAGFMLQDDPDTPWPIALPIVTAVLWLVGGFPWPRALLAVQGRERVYADCAGKEMNAAQFKELMLQPGQVKTLHGSDDNVQEDAAEAAGFDRGVEGANMLVLKRESMRQAATQDGGTTAPTATAPHVQHVDVNPLGGVSFGGAPPYPSFGGPPPYYGAPPAAYPPGAGAMTAGVPAEYLAGGAFDPTPDALAYLSRGDLPPPTSPPTSARSPREKLQSAVTTVIAAARLARGGKRSQGARPESDLWGSAFGQPQFHPSDLDAAVAGMTEGGSVHDSSPPPTLVQFRTTLAVMGVLPAAANFWVALRQRLLSATTSDAAVKALQAMAQVAQNQDGLRNTTVREDVLHVAATSAGCRGGDGGAAAAAVRELVAVLEA